MSTADIGLIGLAVMGQNLVLNMNDHGFTVAVYNRTTSKVDEFLAKEAKGTRIIGAHSLEELVAALKRPRRVMLMVQAGQPVDEFIEQLLPLLEPGDIIIDGGNSNYNDTIRRTAYVESKGLLYIGTGVSGGEEGARHGPSIMPGGSPGGLAARQADLPGHRRQGEAGRRRGGSLLRLGGRERRRALRQDGAQRHRVRRHAAHLRGLPADARRPGHERRRDAQGLRQVEQGQARLVPDRDHPRHPGRTRTPTASRWWTRSWTPPSRRAPASGRASRPLDMGIPLTMIVEAVLGRALSALKDERAAASTVLSGPTLQDRGRQAGVHRTTWRRRSTPPRSSPTPRATC